MNENEYRFAGAVYGHAREGLKFGRVSLMRTAMPDDGFAIVWSFSFSATRFSARHVFSHTGRTTEEWLGREIAEDLRGKAEKAIGKEQMDILDLGGFSDGY